MRELQPDVMLRNRGIGNYGDYYTPERVVPSGQVTSDVPWLVIYPLGSDFSYEPDPAKHKGTGWIVQQPGRLSGQGRWFHGRRWSQRPRAISIRKLRGS